MRKRKSREFDAAEYRALLARLSKPDKTTKEIRLLHNELKKYGGGIPFSQRYPNFIFYVSVIALVVSVIVFIFKIWI